MRRAMIAAALLGLAAGCDIAASVAPGEAAADSPVDPAYKPRVGDRAILFGLDDGVAAESLPLYRDMTAYDRWNHSGRDRPPDHQVDEAEVCRVAASTRVLVRAIRDRDPVGAPPAAEVRLLEGPLKGRDFWTRLAAVARKAAAP